MHNHGNEIESAIAEHIPSIYRDTDVRRLDANMRIAIERWRPTRKHPALLIYGEPGIGKTRTAYKIVERMIRNNPWQSVMAISAPEWFASYTAELGASSARANALLKKTCTVSVLMFDDLFREKNTPRVEDAMWQILEKRFSAGLCTIITSNAVSESLSERYSTPETEKAIRRRLREFCLTQNSPMPEPLPETHRESWLTEAENVLNNIEFEAVRNHIPVRSACERAKIWFNAITDESREPARAWIKSMLDRMGVGDPSEFLDHVLSCEPPFGEKWR